MNEKPRVGNNTPDDLIKRSDALQAIAQLMLEKVPLAGDYITTLNSIPAASSDKGEAVDMVLYCPKCGFQHIDAPEIDILDIQLVNAGMPDADRSWTNPPHKSHLCHKCNHIWRPSDNPTNGVERTKSGKDADTAPQQEQDKLALSTPAGYALVPIEPTQQMLNACNIDDSANSYSFHEHLQTYYKAMLSAAPTAPIDNVREEVEMGCRDCSDNFGTCPNTGLPCGT
jgi:hypothetical protein